MGELIFSFVFGGSLIVAGLYTKFMLKRIENEKNVSRETEEELTQKEVI